jgi:hypothetical protein
MIKPKNSCEMETTNENEIDFFSSLWRSRKTLKNY